MIEFAAVGLFIGGLSRLIRPKRQRCGLLAALMLGVTGAVLAALTAPLLGTGALFDLNLGGLAIASTGAVLLIGAVEITATQRAS